MPDIDLDAIEQRLAEGRIVNVVAQRALLAEVRRLRATLDTIRATLARHPRCDLYEPGDPIQCGWKQAVHDIQHTLDQQETPND